MIEQGKEEKEEHEKLADVLAKLDLQQIIFLGPRVSKYTYPKLKAKNDTIPMEVFLKPTEVLDYINTKGVEGSTILFKGARFMEGIIEHLLHDKKDVSKLARREKMWEIRRKQWGL
jgi:UDP-N-acetylmuramyl pentapeptide synthase